MSRNGFANANMVIMGKLAANHFMSDSNVLDLMDKRRFDIGAMAPKELEGGLNYYGHLNLPGVDIYGYDEVYLDEETGETKPLIPDNMVLMIPSNANFMRAYGLCTYLDDDKVWHAAETTRLLRSYVEHRPDRRFLELQTHPLLIPDKVDSWLVATVC
nr:MAG: major capsid protein E [Bacteriophage sp.]